MRATADKYHGCTPAEYLQELTPSLGRDSGWLCATEGQNQFNQ